MINPAALLLAAALVGSAPARAASDPVAYDAKAAPLDDLCKEMLTGNGYEIRDDGKVWDKIAETPVSQADMPYLLSRLASAKRLRALLQINNIITRYDSDRHLTPDDKEAVRALVRDNWVVFGVAPRNDFRPYFSLEELAALDLIPPRFEAMSPLTMTDPSDESVTAEPPSVTAQPPSKAAAAAPVVAAVPPAAVAAPPSITALPPAAAPAAPAPAAAPAAIPAPVPVAPVAAVVPPPPAPQAVVAAPAAAAAAVVAAPARVIPTLTPMMDLPSLTRGSPFAPAAAAPAPAAAAAAPVAAVAAPAAVVAAPVAVAAAPAAVVAAPVAIAAAPAAIAAAPVAAAPKFTVEPAAPPTLPVIVASPSAPSTSAVVASNLGTLKIWTPAGSTTTAAVPLKRDTVAVSTPVAPPVVAAPPPPPPEAPKAAVVSQEEYEKFVAEGPYNSGGKAVLELIGKRAPDYCLPLLRRTVVLAVPQIVSEGARTGAELRAGFARDAANPLAPPIVALSPGPVFVEVKKSMFGPREAVIIPESPQAWAELGVPRPALDALRPGADAVSTQNGDWGAVRAYADGSRRGSYSITEMAGELLEQLLLLGLSREGLDASPYAARRWARTARLMFYARLAEEMKEDSFLDPDRRAELRDWLDHPDELDDMTVAVWSGSRRQLLDPRRGPPASALEFESRARASCVRSNLEDTLSETSRRRAARVGALESLLDAGLVDAGAAKSAAQSSIDAEESERLRLVAAPPACPANDAAREEGLRKAVLLMAEAARAEHILREHKAGIENHAL